MSWLEARMLFTIIIVLLLVAVVGYRMRGRFGF
jgi:hypothetical protein